MPDNASPQPLWSWPASAGRTASPFERLALEPVTLDGAAAPRQGIPTEVLWAELIEQERSDLHMVTFSKDLAPRAADGSPLAMHQRVAIEATQTRTSTPGGEYVPAALGPGTDTTVAVPGSPAHDTLILVRRVHDDESCPDPRGIDDYGNDVFLARCIDVLASNADPRIPDLEARIEALNTLTAHAGVDVAIHDRRTLRCSGDRQSVVIPDPGRLPLDQAMHRLHGATIGLTRRIANDSGKTPGDRDLAILAAGWTAAHTTQAAAAGLHTLRCDEALAAAAAKIRNDPGAFHHAVELAAATEERLLAPARRDRQREQTHERARPHADPPVSPRSASGTATRREQARG